MTNYTTEEQYGTVPPIAEKINLADLSAEQRKELTESLKEVAKKDKKKRLDDVAAFKKLSETFVEENINPLVHHHEITEVLIQRLWKGYETIKELKAEIYGTRVSGQDSHTSTLEDGSASITIGWNVSIGFDGTESAGVEKIMDVIKGLSDENDDAKKKKLAKIAETFLQPNKKTQMLNPSKIIELSKLKADFDDPRFDEGLDIIFSAQQKRQNSMYVSGWKFLQVGGIPKKLEFRFAV